MKGFNLERVLKFALLICILPAHTNPEVDRTFPSWQRIPALSIAEQVGGGAKRVTYYLNTLLDSCENVEDLNGWILFMDDYLSCDAQTELMPSKKSSTSLKQEEQHLERLREFCAAWPRKRKCSSRLASKLDSCLGFELEDGGAGTNALRLADAHLGFVCRQKSHYLQNSAPINELGEVSNAENRPLNCFHEVEGIVNQCVKERRLKRPLVTFCQQFLLAQQCLVTSFQQCKDSNAKHFLQIMMQQMLIDLKC